jgi:integrase
MSTPYFGRLGRRVEADEMSAGTVQKIHTTLSSIMREAVELGIVAANPCQRVGLPTSSKREMQFLSVEEVRALADAIDPHYRVLILTAALTGLRASELHALRRRDVDLPNTRLHVHRALKAWAQGVPAFGTTKSGRGRAVPLTPTLRDRLAEHLRSVPLHPDALVFTSSGVANAEQRERNPLRAVHQVAWLRNHFKPAVAAALPHRTADPTAGRRYGLRFHDLRHTCASLLLNQGAPLHAVKDWLGHSSITTTVDRYGHLAPGVHEAIAAGLDASFALPGPPTADVVPLRSVG